MTSRYTVTSADCAGPRDSIDCATWAEVQCIFARLCRQYAGRRVVVGAHSDKADADVDGEGGMIWFPGLSDKQQERLDDIQHGRA